MTLYYSDDHVQLHLGDSRQVLPDLDITADVIIADVPYAETSLAWDRWPDGWLDTAAAASTSLWCFGSWRVFGPRWAEFTAAGWKFAQDLVWEKHAGSGFATDRFKRVHETITHWYQGPWSEQYQNVPRIPATDPTDRRTRTGQANRTPHAGAINGHTFQPDGTRLMRSVIKARSMKGRAIHPTQKPIPILSPLVQYSCPPGGLAVDPFAGSGSTLVAARELGRRAVGVEASEEYCAAAAKRLAAIDAQPGLPFEEVGA